MNKEKRLYQNLEIRALDSEKRQIGGYAAVFNSVTKIHPMLNEKVAPGAFGETVKNDDIRALWSHNPDFVLGRNKNNTLKLWEDDVGLAFSLELPDTQIGRDTFTLIKRGDITGMSFGFSIEADKWERGGQNQPHTRTIEKVRLFEISPVAFPAYDQTSVNVRALEDQIKEREIAWTYDEKEKRGPSDADNLRALLTRLELDVAILPNSIAN